MTKLEKKALILLTETETNQVAGGDKGNHYGQKRDLHFIQMDNDPYTFGHQPHALLSRPDLATKHRSCRLPG